MIAAPFPFPLPLRLRSMSPPELAGLEASAQLYQLDAPFRYESPTFGAVEVPAGYVTDFASIPRPVWNLLDPEDPIIGWPSVIHDYLYTRQGDLGLGSRVVFTRENADQVLKEAMVACGASKVKAFIVYLAVRAGGGSHWN